MNEMISNITILTLLARNGCMSLKYMVLVHVMVGYESNFHSIQAKCKCMDKLPILYTYSKSMLNPKPQEEEEELHVPKEAGVNKVSIRKTSSDAP